MNKIEVTVDNENNLFVRANGATPTEILGVASALLMYLKEKVGLSYESSLDSMRYALEVDGQCESSVKNPNEV